MGTTLLKVLLAALALGSTKARDPTSYPGKLCASGADCETSSTGLICAASSNKCECAASFVFYYGSSNKCVLPYGAPCTGSPTEILTPNSECRTVVTCKDGFVFNPNKRCIDPSGACNSDDHCDEDKFQICDGMTKKCECDHNSDPNALKVCQLKVDRTCRVSAPFPTPSCQEVSSCIGGRCICNAGLIANINEQCRVPYGRDCSQGPATPCDETEFTECRTSTKKCDCIGEGIRTRYNPRTYQCELFARAGCDHWGQRCTEFAACDTTSKTCLCVPDFFVSLDKRCVHVTCLSSAYQM